MRETFEAALREADASLAAADPLMARLAAAQGPCDLRWDLEAGPLFPVLASTILYQQLSGKAAQTIERRFVALAAPARYPAARDVLAFSDEALRGAGVSRPKIAALRDLARHDEAGLLPSIEALEEMDDEAIVASLTHVRGIGRWSVEMLLIFRLGRLDVWPTSDLGLRSGTRIALGLDAKPDRRTMEEAGERWRPYRTIAAWRLWRLLDAPPSPGA
jgi:DNA-3-methyladenine glycosylase II